MNRTLLITTLTLVGLVAEMASATAAPLHSNPEPRDNIRLYLFLGSPGATLSLDDKASPVEVNSVMFTRLEPGAHKWTVSLQDGVAASANFTLLNEEAIEAKGRPWWCLAAGLRDGRLTLLQLPSARCKAIADAGPD
jgi:hypothetical protein